MTAADWQKRFWGGGLRFDMWHEVIADLAAVEAERDKWRRIAAEADKTTEDAEAERDRLRKLAYASLANAALREALEEAQDHDCSGSCDGGKEHMRVMDIINAALALPVDGLAEEVIDVLACTQNWSPVGSEARKGADALLAKLGARP